MTRIAPSILASVLLSATAARGARWDIASGSTPSRSALIVSSIARSEAVKVCCP